MIIYGNELDFSLLIFCYHNFSLLWYVCFFFFLPSYDIGCIFAHIHPSCHCYWLPVLFVLKSVSTVWGAPRHEKKSFVAHSRKHTGSARGAMGSAPDLRCMIQKQIKKLCVLACILFQKVHQGAPDAH